jgi:hypothetical protein
MLLTFAHKVTRSLRKCAGASLAISNTHRTASNCVIASLRLVSHRINNTSEHLSLAALEFHVASTDDSVLSLTPLPCKSDA